MVEVQGLSLLDLRGSTPETCLLRSLENPSVTPELKPACISCRL